MRFASTLVACAAAGSVIVSAQNSSKEYDYVIVGGGLTGLVTAARLTEDPDVSVLVLEYGTIDRSNVTQIPYYGTVLNTAALRSILSAPEPHLNNRQYALRAAQIAGGGSQLNGMQWDLPSRADLDAFASLGNPGWDWDGLQPYYQKESRQWSNSTLSRLTNLQATQLTPPDADIEAMYNYSYDLSAHGGPQSPAKISFPDFQYPDMFTFKDAFTELNMPFVEEPAAGNAVGHFWSPSSINAENKTRTSSLYAYYDHVSHRENLELLAKHQVTEILFDDDLAATGVKVLDRDNEQQVTFAAKKEVILAAGAFFTPQILQLSGIGPKSVLSAAGVETKLDFPAVGSNFQDHTTAYLSWNVTNQSPSPNILSTNATFFEEARKLYSEKRTGPLTKAQASYIGFFSLESITNNSKAVLDSAEAFSANNSLPEVYSQDARLIAGFEAQRDILIKSIGAGDVAVVEVPISGGGFIPNAVQKPFSRGTVHLNATDPTGVPVVLHNSLSHPFDRDAVFESLQFTRRLFNSQSVAPLKPVEVTPGPQYTEKNATIERLITSGSLSPTFSHASCSCPMMPQDLGGVVDAELQVYGTKKLSIVDASILPIIPAAHLQATMYSVAEKAADIIKARGRN